MPAKDEKNFINTQGSCLNPEPPLGWKQNKLMQIGKPGSNCNI